MRHTTSVPAARRSIPASPTTTCSSHGSTTGTSERCPSAAWAYAITGEEKYATLAAQVLVGYASRYKTYPYHDSGAKTGQRAAKSGGHLFEQTLNEASALAEEIAPAYDLIHGSKSLSAEAPPGIREGLLRPMLENIAKHKTGKSNWQTWHNGAMLWGGAVWATWPGSARRSRIRLTGSCSRCEPQSPRTVCGTRIAGATTSTPSARS